jgi:hypothetical protein
MDRYTSGEDVAYRELRQVWENTTIRGTLWGSPIYYEFFAAIRDVNRATGSNIRVVLGDPPVDWASIRGVDDINAFYPQRDLHAAEVVQQEVLAKDHRADRLRRGSPSQHRSPCGSREVPEFSYLLH